MSESLPSDISLRADKYGWTAEIPQPRGQYFGYPIRLEIHTCDVPCETEPPPPDQAELALASEVLASLPSILRDAQTEFTNYNAKFDSDATKHIRHPHIWICREFIESGSRWAFVVERDDAPSYGYHVEFDGSQCLGMTAGD